MTKIIEYGIYLIVFCLPLYLVRFDIFNLPTNILEILVGILFIIWIINKCKMQNAKCKINANVGGGVSNISLIISIILILIGVSMATIFSWDLRISAGIWKAWFMVPLIFFVILITTIKKPEQVKKIFYSLIASGFVVSIISLVYLIQGNLDIHGRLQGIYNSPNFLAMYLAPILILCSGLFLIEKNRNLKSLYLVSCILFLATLFFTKSLGAWLGIIGAVLFGSLIFLDKNKKQKLFWIVFILGILIILSLGYFKIFVLSEGGRSFDARLLIWQRAWEAYKMNPIIGIGPGTFEYYFPPYPKWGVPQPHSVYLAFLLQTGIIGFIGFIWLLVWFFRRGIKLLNVNCYVLIVMCIMAYILIHGLVDTTYWKNDLAVMFWIILALLSTADRFSYSQTLNNSLEGKEINQ